MIAKSMASAYQWLVCAIGFLCAAEISGFTLAVKYSLEGRTVSRVKKGHETKENRSFLYNNPKYNSVAPLESSQNKNSGLTKHQIAKIKGERRKLKAAAAEKRRLEQEKLAEIEASKLNKFYFFDPKKPETQTGPSESHQTSRDIGHHQIGLHQTQVNSSIGPYPFTFPILSKPTERHDRLDPYAVLDEATRSKNPLAFDFAAPDVLHHNDLELQRGRSREMRFVGL